MYKLLSSLAIWLLKQCGHPLLLVVLCVTDVYQVWPSLHFQSTFFAEPYVISFGVILFPCSSIPWNSWSSCWPHSPLFKHQLYRLLSSLTMLYLKHCEHPLLLSVLLTTVAYQVWPLLHLQSTLFSEPLAISFGVILFPCSSIPWNSWRSCFPNSPLFKHQLYKLLSSLTM